jgi:hypothetical protein
VSILDDAQIREALRQAWDDSQPDTPNAHEEGGFVLLTSDGSSVVERWPRGLEDEILVPDHTGGRRAGLIIVATFHTHPNSGEWFCQEPSPMDVQAVENDPELDHSEYEGEYVISRKTVYRINRDGGIDSVGGSLALLGVR